jgi:hypothetical protein
MAKPFLKPRKHRAGRKIRRRSSLPETPAAAVLHKMGSKSLSVQSVRIIQNPIAEDESIRLTEQSIQVKLYILQGKLYFANITVSR